MTKSKHALPIKNKSAVNDQEWLAQFEPVSDEKLTRKQERFVAALRHQFPEGRAGYRNGLLCFYAIDRVTGRFVGPLPHDNE